MAARTWTLEQRQRQAEAIRRWKPWEKSTGPRSDEGKRRVRDNGVKHGAYTAEAIVMRRHLAEAIQLSRQVLGEL